MAKEVEICLPADGSNDVLLSALYQVCPELFAVEITPLNESTVTLPAKLSPLQKAAPEANSPLAPRPTLSKPPGRRDAPFLLPPKSSPARSDAERANPLWPPEKEEVEPAPQSHPLSDMSGQEPQWRTPDDAAESEPPKGSGQAAVVNGFTSPSSPGGHPFDQSPEAEKKGPATNEEPSPATPFSGIPFEIEGGYSTLFSIKAEEDSEIPFPSPAQKIASSPENIDSRPESPSEGTWGTMFDAKTASETSAEVKASAKGLGSTGNLIPGSLAESAAPTSGHESERGVAVADEDYGVFLHPSNEGCEVPAALQMDSSSELAPDLENEKAAFEGNVSTPSIVFEPLPQSLKEGFSEVKSEPKPIPVPDDPAAMPAKSAARAERTAFSCNSGSLKEAQYRVSEERKLAPAPACDLEPVATQTVASGAIPGVFRPGEIKDLELRAIFSTNDSFTLRSVAQRVVALPGIASCALATPGRLVQASRNEESRIGDEAKEIVQTIRSLAKLTGIPDAQSFTLHTDRGIISLFLDGECCLTIHHESGDFGPGIREKMILVSRNLENLER